MFDKITSDYFFSQLSVISEIQDNNQKLASLNKIFKEMIDSLTVGNIQFSSYFSKLSFLIENYSVPEDISRNFLYARNLMAFVLRKKERKAGNEKIQLVQSILFQFLSFFSESSEEYMSIKEPIIDYNEISLEDETVKCDIQEAFVISKIKSKKSIRLKDKNGVFVIDLQEPWLDFYKLCWRGCHVSLYNLIPIKNQERKYTVNLETLIIIEPDYLIDATDVASVFLNTGAVPLLYFIKKFVDSSVSEKMIIGNIVNTIFDELLSDSSLEFEQIFDKAIREKPIPVMSLAVKDKNVVNRIKTQVKIHYDNLKIFIESMHNDKLSLEASFISPKYGLQGRLDALLEYHNDSYKKDIIELKSGSFPNTELGIKTLDGKFHKALIWNNNLAQTTCYNLLLDSTFISRTGVSNILYSGSKDKPLRNAENIPHKKQEIINIRNWFLAYDYSLRRKSYKFLEKIKSNDYENLPSFMLDSVREFAQSISQADNIAKKYFYSFLTLILNEIYFSKIGNSFNRGFSALWKDTIDEKKENYSIITDLVLNKSKTDFSSFYLHFNSNNDELNLTSIRTGDLIILYQYSVDEDVMVYNNQILKGVVKEITNSSIVISLRNKQTNSDIFQEDKNWIIEPDYIDSTNKRLLNSIFQILKYSKEKREKLFGLKEPEFNTDVEYSNKDLNLAQETAVRNAIASKDYFLIQGPPGTGKTSYVLKNIVQEIVDKTDENLLILAFTNKAVDEICSSLKSLDSKFDFLRTGSKESSIHQDILISSISEKESLNSLYTKIKTTRIIVSTVSSIIANPEFMELKHFNTAIVDEASQILEPQLVGIISKINRFILIGDEKQLPAIITQDETLTIVEDEDLTNIGLSDLRLSLFERLVNICNKNKWTQATSLLKYQARMHQDIQEFPNKNFYNNQLEVFDKLKQSVNDSFVKIEGFNLKDKIFESRVVFINTQIEKTSKINKQEAAIVSEIIEEIISYEPIENSDNYLGVISPFRAQCNEIYRNLNPKLRNSISCDTVERFQGSEREIIIISMAVNFESQLKSIQSTLAENSLVDRKLNVAMTRAKEQLIILGNSEILSKIPVYSLLIEHIKSENGYFEFSDLHSNSE